MSIPKTSAWSWNIYLGSNLIAEGGCGRWRPWANTIAYYPLTITSTVNDMKGSWTAYNLTNNGYVSFWTYDWVDCAFFNRTTSQSWSNWLLRTTDSIIQSTCTISLWMKKGSNSLMLHYPRIIWTPTDNQLLNIRRDSYYSQWQDWSIISSFSRDDVLADSSEVWRNVIILINNWTISYYVNNELKYTYSGSVTINNWITLWSPQWRTQTWDTYYWYLSEVIIENKIRSDQERSSYYNNTKSNYWL